ncbi:6-carboxytetrahydropterin synthase QueD [Orenia metallireducens]|uniref:6-carboxy-5,6,7,8-tetrahydropterin synthase n=1 Tax=Orenia metallireducens TaxID=1413210 RepID=A0A1C0ACH9_9FIRM|nr:6-carboxytetrahydropterin synthase [Orenia metallireducens]OCL28089.1 6-carboxytetrahydropterin synthase QueD [Orenia metallireducens]
MITVTKEFSWDMSHMLAEHEGLCKNLHGHTYRMEVTVAKKEGSLEDEGSKAGMVIDFKDLKEIVKEEIISPLDHSFMYWTHSSDEIEHQLAQILQQADRKVFAVDFRPTAEMMAIYFFQSLEDKFNEIDIDLVSIKVWETPTSYAEFRGER